MNVLHWLDSAVRKALPFSGSPKNSIRDGFGNELEADISPEMEAYLAEQRANDLPDEIPELTSGIDNEEISPRP